MSYNNNLEEYLLSLRPYYAERNSYCYNLNEDTKKVVSKYPLGVTISLCFMDFIV